MRPVTITNNTDGPLTVDVGSMRIGPIPPGDTLVIREPNEDDRPADFQPTILPYPTPLTLTWKP